MTPDSRELKALEEALDRFDGAYVDLVQAARRILRICAAPDITAQSSSPSPSATTSITHHISTTGNFCEKCGSARLERKGGGCTRCLDCGFDLGCGG